MKQKSVIITAVLLLLLLILAACGGDTSEDTESAAEEGVESDEILTDPEAVGSESAGVIMPTPIMGAKVQPTRMAAGTAVPTALDILIITQAANLPVGALNAIGAELGLLDTRVGLSLYGETAPVGAMDFTADVAELTAVLNQTASLTQTVTIADALLAGMELPGWRENSPYRLIFLVVEPPFSPGAEATISELTATAVTQDRRIFPILMGNAATAVAPEPTWEDVALATNGRVIPVDDSQIPEDTLAIIISGVVAELFSDVTP